VEDGKKVELVAIYIDQDMTAGYVRNMSELSSFTLTSTSFALKRFFRGV
jgi:hypothetical protein